MFGFVKEDTYLELLEEKTDLEQEVDNLKIVIDAKNDEIIRLRYKRGGDGNAVLRQEAAKVYQKYTDLCLQVGDLQGQVATLTAERNYWKRRCTESVKVLAEDPKKETSGDEFQSRDDGLSTKEVQMRCFEAKVDGDLNGDDPSETMFEIAEQYEIGYGTVPSYISKGKAHYRNLQIELSKNVNGRITRKKFPISQIDSDGKLHSDTFWSIDFTNLSHEEWERILKYHHSSIE